MASIIGRYSCISMPGVNQVKNMDADATGYRPCIIGALAAYNESGHYYPFIPSVKQLFEPGGLVRRRLDSGLCRGEYGHPKVQHLPLPQALQRLAQIDPLLTSHHIKSVELVDGKDEKGRSIILEVAQVKPTGPYGPTLESQMDNTEENVAFSVRAFTTTDIVGGVRHKVINSISTWDVVSEPGIKQATQFTTAALEEYQADLLFTEYDLNNAIISADQHGLESDSSYLTMVKTSLGWNKVQVIDLRATDWK